MIEDKLHPILQKDPRLTVEYNMHFDQFDAAKVFGWSAYWNASLDEREAMIAHCKARQVIDAIVRYEEAERRREEWKRNHGK